MKNLYKVLLLGWAGLMLTSRVVGDDQPAPEKGDTRARTKADLDAVRVYLEKNYPGKTWDKGPERIESPEINAAYGKTDSTSFSPPNLDMRRERPPHASRSNGCKKRSRNMRQNGRH